MTGKIPQRVANRAAMNMVMKGECWESTYSVASHGYAQVGWWVGGKHEGTTAHRAAYVFYSGEQIPAGMTVDHTCRNRRCVRPVHLRLATNVDNARMNVPTNGHYPETWACPRDHASTSRRTLASGKSVCVECRRLSQESYRMRKRQAA